MSFPFFRSLQLSTVLAVGAVIALVITPPGARPGTGPCANPPDACQDKASRDYNGFQQSGDGPYLGAKCSITTYTPAMCKGDIRNACAFVGVRINAANWIQCGYHRGSNNLDVLNMYYEFQLPAVNK